VTAPANPLFSWQANATAGGEVYVDLSTVMSKVAGTVNSITGYPGTDTMPWGSPTSTTSCATGVCWYVVNQVYQINQDELNFFQM
jgi:hypothetical protein